MRTYTRFGLTAVLFVASAAILLRAQDRPIYRDPARSVDDRVADLLSRMTLEEKVAQLQAIWNQKSRIQDADGRFNPANARAVLGNGIGEVSRPSEIGTTPTGPRLRAPREQAEFTNAIQRWVIENTRLGIPVLFHEEALHGLAALRGTHFPVPLGLASSWDPTLIERVMSVAAREARSRGAQQVLSPVVDLGRDARWGRIEETYGEDPYLVSRLGVAAVRGYQGTSLPLAKDKVFATLKHLAGHGSHEGGINTAPTLIPERLLRAELLVPFETAIREARAFSVMPSYNEVDGVPSHANRWLLDDVLRKEWGFTGLIVSDYYGIEQLASRHRVATDRADAARQALDAGIDIELPDPAGYPELLAMVKSGRISESALTTPVSRVLRAKFLAGLFETPYADPAEAERLANSADHQAAALDAARRSLVLLKNANNLLPLDRSRIKTLAVIGPNAKGVHLGGYSKDPGRGIDVLSGITEKAGPAVKILYSEGTRITEEPPNWDRDAVTLARPDLNRTRIAEATMVARQADAIVVVIGTNESTSREAWADNHLGDAASLSLMGQQDDLVEAMVQTGKPVVAVLINGRPQAIPRVADRAPAILEAWYAGQEGGTAVAEALFGELNPGGKLPITIPRDTGQVPVYYNRRPTSFRSYVDLTREPLWAFGFGLSYTTYALANLQVTPDTIGPGGRATVTVDVTNTGTRAGDEVVQLYVHDMVSSVTRPVKELAGFERVTLRPGEKKTVTFSLGPEALSLIDRRMQRGVEPGTFEVLLGTSSNTSLKATIEVAPR
jgi:beta-glucosidase-like glycosyl hydrolase